MTRYYYEASVKVVNAKTGETCAWQFAPHSSLSQLFSSMRFNFRAMRAMSKTVETVDGFGREVRTK